MMDQNALLATLPQDRQELWQRVALFLNIWRKPLDARSGSPADKLEKIETSLGQRFPDVLREMYLLMGEAIDSIGGHHPAGIASVKGGGYLNDEHDCCFGAKDCYVERRSTEGQKDDVLVFGENYWGSLWGVRMESIVQSDPPVVCVIDSHTIEDVPLKVSIMAQQGTPEFFRCSD